MKRMLFLIFFRVDILYGIANAISDIIDSKMKQKVDGEKLMAYYFFLETWNSFKQRPLHYNWARKTILYLNFFLHGNIKVNLSAQ